jgi:hypothetical protein
MRSRSFTSITLAHRRDSIPSSFDTAPALARRRRRKDAKRCE